MPCLTALNRERFLPSGVRGPVLFWALRRLISARSGLGGVVVVMVLCPGVDATEVVPGATPV